MTKGRSSTLGYDNYKQRIRRRRDGTCCTWLKRNWVLLGLTGLAAAGVVLAILLLFEPCERETVVTTTERPFDIVQAADASGSISSYDWRREEAAAKALLRVFYNETTDAAVSWVQWSSGSSVSQDLTPIPSVEWIDDLVLGAQEQRLTYYAQALYQCDVQFREHGRPGQRLVPTARFETVFWVGRDARHRRCWQVRGAIGFAR